MFLTRILLALLLLHTRATGRPDFCHADPRLQFHHTTCNNAIETAIFLPYLPYNPYHSLHDHLWALSHYLSHCTRAGTRRVIFAGKGAFDLTVCREREDAPRVEFGLWMPCVYGLLAHHYGIPTNDLRAYPKNGTWPAVASVAGCARQAVLFGGEPSMSTVSGYGKIRTVFRGLSWFGADCGGSDPRGSCFGFQQITSGVVPLPDEYKAKALRAIRDAVYDYLQVERFVTHGDQINVLVYDRNDTNWRQWTNALQIVHLLEKDARLDVRYIRTTPVSFSAQVELYYWADIVIAPHGAAMASTIFMKPGADIVEIYTTCDANIIQNRYMPQKWTGWHPYLMNLHLQYVQCHMADKAVKTEDELDDEMEAFHIVTGRPHIVDVEQVMPVIKSAIKRQESRVGRRRLVGEGYPILEVVHSQDVFPKDDTGLEWVYAALSLIFVVVCSFSLVVRRLRRKKKYDMD